MSELTDEDRNEMALIARQAKDAGFDCVLVDTDHALGSLKTIEESEARNEALVRDRFRRTEIIGEMERAFECPPDERPFDGYDPQETDDWVRGKIYQFMNYRRQE